MAVHYREVQEASYLPLEVDQLIEGKSLPFDVWIREGDRFVLLLMRRTVFDLAARAILSEKGISTVFVREADGPAVEGYVGKTPEEAPPAQAGEVPQAWENLKDQYMPVDRSLLIPGVPLPFSLINLSDRGVNVLLQATEREPRSVEDDMLRVDGDIAVRNEDLPLYRQYLDSLCTSSGGNEAVRSRTKTIALKETSKLLIKGLLEDPRSGENIKKAVVSARALTDCIFENRNAVADLLSLKTYDLYTYAHSVNVAALSVGLGASMGMKRADVELLGIGALLHDIGKSAIPKSVLNKPGKLTDEEFSIMKTHVREGGNLLRHNPDIPERSITVVMQHHERLSGKGYPRGSVGREISLFGRIASIIDCYDALTTDRPYQKARTPFFAISLITREQGDYDRDISALLIKMLGAIGL